MCEGIEGEIDQDSAGTYGSGVAAGHLVNIGVVFSHRVLAVDVEIIDGQGVWL